MVACPRRRRARNYLRRTLAVLATLVVSLFVAPGQASASQSFTNPLNSSGPDPAMTWYDGNYYLMTTPWDGPLTMRKSPTIAQLKTTDPVPVFGAHAAGRDRSIWAPEFHLLNGPNGRRWYIYYSAGDGNIESQRVHVLESAGLDPMGPYTYRGMVFGSNDWWGIDGSVVTINDQLYFTWSGVPTKLWRDSVPHIYIVAMSNPWTVTGNRTAISEPTYDWEKQGSPMNEGPVAIQHDGRTFMTYSASACQGPDYKIGMLTYTGGDVLSASSWVKKPTPVFERNDAAGVYGPAHHAFFKSPDGTEDWVVYHANSSPTDSCGATRTTRIQRISWNADGTPNLGVPVSTSAVLAPPSGEPADPAPGTPPADEITDGLALWYKLDQSSGTAVADASGHGRNGTVNGTASWGGDSGLAFNGTDTYVKAPDNLIRGMDSITVATDVLIDASQQTSYFIYGFGNPASSSSGTGYLFSTGDDYRAALTTGNWSGEQNTAAGRKLARGMWKHIAYTQTGTTGVLYENGAEVARNTKVTVKPSAVGGGATTMDYLGRSMYAADRLFKGRMRDFRVYDRALEPAEVQRLAGRVKPSPLAADTEALKLDGLDDVTGDLTLPKAGAGGSGIGWKSGDPAVLSDEGKVTRPAPGRPDAHVTLTATLTWGGATQTKGFDVTVRAEFDDSTKANRARDALVVHNIEDVRGNLTLPATGQYGAAITWDSKRKDVISDDGTVHRPAPGTATLDVNLIATVDVNGSKASRTFQAKVPPLPAEQDLKGYLFSYFTGEGTADGEQIYFALSKGNDPLHWRELNDGKPVLRSTMGEQGVRDPYIVRSPEGDKFYQIATDLKINGGKGWGYEMQHGSLSLEIWESTDLVHWSEQRHVRVSADTAGMTWAPEATYDPTLGAYVVYWASNLYRADDPNHTGSTYPRMMYATTRDFHTFSEPKVWNDPGKGVIDSTVIRHGAAYYRFTTDDKLVGSCERDIVQERSTSLTAVDLPGTKPRNWQLVSDCIRTKAGTDWVEGPTVFKSNTEDKWYLFADETPKRGYLPFETTDLAGGKWTMPTDYALPKSPRHGTVLPITQAEYDRMLRTYLPAELVDSVAEVTARTPAGTAPELPDSVTATFADGTTKQTQVTWDEIKPADYASAGTFVVQGTIKESGTIRARATVTVFTSDSANAGPDAKGAEGTSIRLTGASAGAGAVAWSVEPAAGVDPGAACTFTDPASAATTVTCTDDGTYEVTLKVGEVTDTATVTVTNAVPRIGAITAPATTIAGKAFPVTVRFTDPGKNDKQRCVAHLGQDRNVTATDGVCTFEHTYRTAGTYKFAVSVVDDDGGVTTGFHTITVTPADRADAGPAARGAEGAAIRLAGQTTGSAGPAWSYRPLSGVDWGATCKFADPRTADTTITCTDDGIYEVVLRSGTATGKTRLTVINKIPVITAAAGPAPVKAGKPVTVSATFTDPGRHDTHACTVDWSGGNTARGSVAGGRCTAAHTYRRAGTYRVKVTVTDDDGGAVSRTVTVVVRAAR